MLTSRVVSLARLAAGLFFLAFVVGQSPHLVHHLFEPDETRSDCAFSVAAERLAGLTVAVDDPGAEQRWEPAAEADRPPGPPSRTLRTAGPRAPPPSAA